MKRLVLFLSLFIVVGCGPSELDRCIEANEKNYSISFEDMLIKLTFTDIKNFIKDLEEMLEFGNTPLHLERYANKVFNAWSRNDFEEIQNLYHSEINSKKKLTNGYLKEYAEDFVKDYCLYDAFEVSCNKIFEEQPTYEQISFLNQFINIDDLYIDMYLRIYDENNLKGNKYDYAKNLCHSQGVY